MFLSETKKKATSEERLMRELGFDGQFSVPSVDSSGGLLLLWKNSVDVTLNSYSSGHIDITIKEVSSWWRFTGFYGNPDVYKEKRVLEAP